LRESWYPLSEASGNDHFTPGGHAFFAFLLSHELLKNGWVPKTPRSRVSRSPGREAVGDPAH
jgi:hypothetical protein